MKFIVKDLMISVLPLRPSGSGGFPGGGCGDCTPCSNDCTRCSISHRFEDWLSDPDPNRLAALKQQLRGTLAAVEAREKALYDEMRPRTVAEVENLQKL